MKPPSRIPFVVRVLLRVLVPKRDLESFLGDLEEQRSREVRGSCPPRGGRRLWAREILGALTLRFGQGPIPPPSTDTGVLVMLDDIPRDIRFALRQMARRPASTTVVLLILALGIGANTAIFSLVDGVLLEPLSYPDSQRLVVLRENNLSRGWASFPLSPDNFLDWRERTRSFDRMAAYQRTRATRTQTDRPEVLTTYRVTREYLEILGAKLVLGRGFLDGDFDPAAPRVAVLDHGFWERAFGADRGVVGRSIELEGEAATIVGVLQSGWRPLDQGKVDVILPLQVSRHPSRRGGHWLSAIARLAPGVTRAQAQEEVSEVATALEAEFPESNAGWGGRVLSLEDSLWGDTRLQLLLFMGVVMVVLLVASANVASIMMSRAMVRRREMAIRVAVGAGRGRLIRQGVTEHLLVSGLGGGLGIGVAYLTLNGLLLNHLPWALPRLDQVHIGLSALLFALGAAVAVGLGVGVLVLRPGGMLARGPSLTGSPVWWTRGPRRGRLRGGLVAAEVALTVVLLVGSGLLVRSYSALEQVDPGFRTAHRLVFTTPLPSEKYRSSAELRAYADATLQRLNVVPGVVSTAVSTFVPIRGGVDVRWQVTFEGRPPPGPTELDEVHLYRISPGYFDAMGIPLVRGRLLSPQDGRGSSPVVVVSESFVRAHYPTQDPLGRRIRIGGGEPPWAEIVGVVGSVRDLTLGETSLPQVYEPLAQRERVASALTFVTLTSGPPEGLVEALRAEILAVDPDQALVGVQALGEVLEDDVALPRFRTYLVSSFGVMALILAVIGVYGVVSFAVGRRFHEFGVRMALGADGPSILFQVFRDGAPMILAGIAVGLGGAFLLSRLLESMLFEVGARDVGVFVLVPLLLLASAALAMLLPGLRATRIEPAGTLTRK